jgi:hypothetical protein
MAGGPSASRLAALSIRAGLTASLPTRWASRRPPSASGSPPPTSLVSRGCGRIRPTLGASTRRHRQALAAGGLAQKPGPSCGLGGVSDACKGQSLLRHSAAFSSGNGKCREPVYEPTPARRADARRRPVGPRLDLLTLRSQASAEKRNVKVGASRGRETETGRATGLRVTTACCPPAVGRLGVCEHAREPSL